MEPTEHAAAPPTWANSKDAWLNRVHDAVLPSGMHVTYRDPSIAELALLGELPAELLEVALAEWDEPGSAADMARKPLDDLPNKPTKKQRAAAEEESRNVLRQLAQVNRHLIAAALVAPAMTVDDLEHVPMPDLEMLAGLINRTIAKDAANRTVGVVLVDRFHAVLAAHGLERCPADCAACEEARRAMATSR